MHWLGRYRLLILASICVFWTGLIFLGHFFPMTPFLSVPWRGEQSFEDLLRKEGRKTATRNDFVFLGLDQSTLQLPPLTAEEVANNRAFQLMTERPFPWSREIWWLLASDKIRVKSGKRRELCDQQRRSLSPDQSVVLVNSLSWSPLPSGRGEI